MLWGRSVVSCFCDPIIITCLNAQQMNDLLTIYCLGSELIAVYWISHPSITRRERVEGGSIKGQGNGTCYARIHGNCIAGNRGTTANWCVTENGITEVIVANNLQHSKLETVNGIVCKLIYVHRMLHAEIMALIVIVTDTVFRNSGHCIFDYRSRD